MQINKVTCNVYEFNKASFNMFESSGFKLEGILRQHTLNYASQTLVDVKVYSLFVDEFSESRLARSLSKYKL